jgi:transcriptional accessory protein Tex/SPT6
MPRREFPHEDATVRGAVSIGGRLIDPLAELVKIEPNAIGVGQYQHDVDQSALRRALDEVVSSCVNLVGVDVNAASRELYRPGRDPRKEFEAFSFTPGIEKLEDLQVGMKLPGIVTNVTAFGAFVDIGVHQDGLVHISQLRDVYVKNPIDVVKPRQKVTVKVLDVDLERKRISLSMKKSECSLGD